MLKKQYKDEISDPKLIKNEERLDDLKEDELLEVFIETVNPNEFFAAMLQMKKDCGISMYAVKDHSDSEDQISYYYVGKWSDKEIPVVIIQTNMGSEGIHGCFNETKKALKWLPHLKYIFAVGVCGGIKGKVKLGDVVVSKAIQSYTYIKPTNKMMIIRSERTECADEEFYHFLSRAANTPDGTKFGLVLSANVLVADDEFQLKLLEACPEAKVIEMEGHGIAKACKKKNIEILVVKGVSDLGDSNKDDTWQPQAAMNAARVLCGTMAASNLFSKKYVLFVSL